jgi:hypothetical protein
MRRIASGLLVVLVLVAGLVALAALGLVAFWFGPLAALFAALAGVCVVWTLFDRPASSYSSS